jgi:succinyl-diaminopimelate desuccinylase
VAEEETGSKLGISHLISQGLFKKEDILLVPDGGVEDGTLVEVSEKSIMWLKVRTIGKQVHASIPDKGINAHKAAMRFGTRVCDLLFNKYDFSDPLFDPPRSTFEPTKKEANVPNVNTVPGEDVFYLDMRIHPKYDPEDVVADIERTAKDVEKETGARFEFERVNYQKSPPTTPPDSPVVKMLMEAIVAVKPIKPFAGGIGGGTCAALFRKMGYNAVVWSIMDETGHSPNEYCKVQNLLDCTKVYAAFYLKA